MIFTKIKLSRPQQFVLEKGSTVSDVMLSSNSRKVFFYSFTDENEEVIIRKIFIVKLQVIKIDLYGSRITTEYILVMNELNYSIYIRNK